MAGLPKKYAKMGFKKGWAAYKKSKRKTTTTRKRTVKRKTAPTKRRRSTVARRRKYVRRKKYTTVSVMSIGHMAMQYSNITGAPLGAIVDELIGSILDGNGDPLEIIMEQAKGALTNITENPAGIALRGALIGFLFTQGKQIVGRKVLFTVGKFRITV
jgi:hypothetical protein